MKNILFIGLGSIGQRHFRNLKKIGKNFKFFAVRKKNNSPKLDINNKVIGDKFLSHKNEITEITRTVSKKINFHSIFVCNPSSMHLKTSLLYGKKTKNLFIEKPLSNNLRNINKLRKFIELNKINCALGFQLRYHPYLKKIKDIIDKENLGKIKKVYLRNSHYLPYHHKYEDYKNGYAAKKSLGGGVILCFTHEIDYANYLFGKPLNVFCSGGNKSKLKLDVEDFANIKINYTLKKNNFLVQIDLDFIERIEKRYCKIFFEKGYIYWDLKKDNLTVKKKNKSKIKLKSIFKNRNDLFLKQLKDVMNSFKKRTKPLSNIHNGVSSLQVAMAAKKSMKIKKAVKLRSFL